MKPNCDHQILLQVRNYKIMLPQFTKFLNILPLARHLGHEHDVRVHREFYHLQKSAVELTNVSRLLLAVDQGEAQKYTGKELKDINIEGIYE